MTKSFSKFLNVFLTMTFASQSVFAVAVSGINEEFEKSSVYRKINNKMRKDLNIPYYFTVPLKAYAPVSDEILSNRTSNISSPAVLFNYRESRTTTLGTRPDSEALGLRLIAIDGKQTRAQSSNALAESGLIKTGDILLSYRREWFGTLRYSHIQLGVSHAGMAYVNTAADGKKYVYNIDMPMDEKTVGADARLSSEHYEGAPFLHVLRFKGLTEQQRSNIGKWIKAILVQRPYPSRLSFNKDYASPNYENEKPLKFVGDLGRIALGLPSDNASMYCSEFVWSMLTLRNCDPATDAKSFESNLAPSCLSEAFKPMPVLGNLLDGSSDEPIIGMSDGPAILADVLKARPKSRMALIHEAVFDEASGNPENISSGHKAVENAILGSNPKFYEMLEQYYNLTDMKQDQNLSSSAIQTKLQIRQGFNTSQKLNYSPTSFQMHALVSNDIEAKRIEYVGTIAYLKPTVVEGKSIDPYVTLLNVVKKLK